MRKALLLFACLTASRLGAECIAYRMEPSAINTPETKPAIRYWVCTTESEAPSGAVLGDSVFAADTGVTKTWTGIAWAPASAPSTSIPSGLVTMILSGTCPTGWTEATALSGKMFLGTTSAAGDVGGTGGSSSITPAGTVSASFTGTAWSAPAIAWPVGVPTHSGTTASFSGTAWTPPAISLGTLAVTAHTVVSTKQGSSTGNVVTTATHALTGAPTIGAYTPAGSVTITSQGTNAWPVAVPTIGAYTPAGSVSGSFVGTAFNPTPPFVKVIFCTKT